MHDAIRTMVGMGFGFALAFALLALLKAGVLTYPKLSRMRRYVMIMNLASGVLLTTPEVVTQIFVALTLQILFEATVLVAWFWERQDKKRAGAAQA